MEQGSVVRLVGWLAKLGGEAGRQTIQRPSPLPITTQWNHAHRLDQSDATKMVTLQNDPFADLDGVPTQSVSHPSISSFKQSLMQSALSPLKNRTLGIGLVHSVKSFIILNPTKRHNIRVGCNCDW